MAKQLTALCLTIALTLLLSQSVLAARPTQTPIPTATPYPTYTPAPTATPYPTYTVVATATPYPQGPGPNGTYCTGGLLNTCLDLGSFFGAIVGAIKQLLGHSVVSVFRSIEHLFGNEFDALTAPFTHALTYTPDITKEDSWAGLRTFQTTLQELAGVLFVGFLTIGVFGAYLSSIGVGDFAQITSPVRRAALVTGFIAGYQELMSAGFSVLNGVTGFVTNTTLTNGETAWQALRGALLTVTDVTSPTGFIDLLVVALGVILTLLCVVVRMMGLGMLAALYVVGPLALVTWLSPQFDFIARWWVKTFITLALWPLGYALGLKVIQILLASGGPLSEFSGLASALAALGLLLGLYRVPAIVGSMVGAGGALLGATASAVADAGIAASVSLATRSISSKIPVK